VERRVRGRHSTLAGGHTLRHDDPAVSAKTTDQQVDEMERGKGEVTHAMEAGLPCRALSKKGSEWNTFSETW